MERPSQWTKVEVNPRPQFRARSSRRLSLRERNGAIRTPIAASKGSATGRAWDRSGQILGIFCGQLRRPSRACDVRTPLRGVVGGAHEGVTLSLAFMSPALAEAAMEGRLPRGFCIKRLTDLPMLWSE